MPSLAKGRPERIIQITNEPFNHGFDLRIIPPLDGQSLDQEFSDYRVARGYASGYRMIHGWRIVDKTGLAT